MLGWLGLVTFASIRYLIARDDGYTPLAGLWLIPLVALFVLGWFYYGLRSTPRKPPPELVDGGEQRVALLVVHGMGVQDRYQMLDQFTRALPEYTQRYAGTLTLLRGRSTESLTLRLDGHLVEVHEAYWGYLFNRLTTLPKTALFGVKTLWSFIPGLFTRFAGKRWGELAWVTLALGTLTVILTGVYGGFCMAADELENLNQPMKYQIDHTKGRHRRESPMDSIGLLKNQDSDGNWQYINRFGDPVQPPTYGQRLYATVRFVRMALRRGFSPSTWRRPIPIQHPLETLGNVEGSSLFWSSISSIGFALLFMSFVKFFQAQFKFLWAGRNGPKGNPDYTRRALSNWVTNTWVAVRKGMIPLLIVLYLDPTLDLLLVQLVTTAAVLFVALRGLRWWVINFLGDVEIYATLDENSEYFEAREKATDLVKEQLSKLLADDRYERVIMVGHSLGSVIASNAVRRCQRECDSVLFGKFAAFVTIGSPLRKFRQLFRALPYKWSFGDNALEWDKDIFIGDDFEPKGRVPWFNYWYGTDVFADRLAYESIGGLKGLLADATKAHDANAYKGAFAKSPRQQRDLTGFRVGDGRDCNLGPRPGIWTHSDYWLDHRFVDDVLDMCLMPRADLMTWRTARKPIFRENCRDFNAKVV